VRGDGKSAGAIRSAALVATGKPGTLQIRLVDPATRGAREGLCACTGDSGSPVFEDQQSGAAIVGVVSWSTGANGSGGCGGITGVTPLTLYRDWILQTARQWGVAL
jgi:secreted trypsin-like serine protease